MDGGSALEAQQRIGAEIPFENISATQRGMGMALGAFYHAAEMSRKRQQLENQLLMADQKNKEQERWHDIEMENFRQNAVTRMMSLENRGAAENAMLQAKADRLALDQEKFQTGVDKYRAGVAGERGLFASFGDPDAPKPGSKGFENYYWNKLSEFAEGADRPGGRILAARLAVEHNKNASRQWDKLNSDKKQFVMDAGTDLGLPVDPLSRTRDLAALEHPEMWKQQYRIKGDKSGKTLGEEVKSQPDWEKKYEATDQRYFPIYTKDKNGNTVIDHYVTQPKSKIDAFRKRYSELNNRANDIPDQITAPGIPPERAATSYHPITSDTAKAILDEAGGDAQKARELARQRGYDF